MSCGNSHSKKSNSVWILTKSALHSGVQSTTRYRKSGSSKKASHQRTPAVQRQKSGAKGGQAARRAAKMRARQRPGRSDAQSLTPISLKDPSHEDRVTYYCKTETDYFTSYDPETPEDHLFVTAAGMDGFPATSYPTDYHRWEDPHGRASGLYVRDISFLTTPDVDLDEFEDIKARHLE